MRKAKPLFKMLLRDKLATAIFDPSTIASNGEHCICIVFDLFMVRSGLELFCFLCFASSFVLRHLYSLKLTDSTQFSARFLVANEIIMLRILDPRAWAKEKSSGVENECCAQSLLHFTSLTSIYAACRQELNFFYQVCCAHIIVLSAVYQ